MVTLMFMITHSCVILSFYTILQVCIYHIKLEEERGPGEHDVGPPVDGDGGEHEAVESVQPGKTQ